MDLLKPKSKMASKTGNLLPDAITRVLSSAVAQSMDLADMTAHLELQHLLGVWLHCPGLWALQVARQIPRPLCWTDARSVEDGRGWKPRPRLQVAGNSPRALGPAHASTHEAPLLILQLQSHQHICRAQLGAAGQAASLSHPVAQGRHALTSHWLRPNRSDIPGRRVLQQGGRVGLRAGGVREGSRGRRPEGVHGRTACRMHAGLLGWGSLARRIELAGLGNLQTRGLLQDRHDQVGRQLLLEALHDSLGDLHDISAWLLCLLQQLLKGCQQLRCDGRGLVAAPSIRSLRHG